MKYGSLQLLSKNNGEIGDYGCSKFRVDDVQNIAALDLRILNCDRNEGNILVHIKKPLKGGSAHYKLIPIDHGLSFPDNLNIAEFEIVWFDWPQVKKPQNPKQKEHIQNLDTKENQKLLQKSLKFRPICLRNFRIAETLLKEAVKMDFTLHEIAKIIYKEERDVGKSLQEKIVEKAEIVYQTLSNAQNRSMLITQNNQYNANGKNKQTKNQKDVYSCIGNNKNGNTAITECNDDISPFLPMSKTKIDNKLTDTQRGFFTNNDIDYTGNACRDLADQNSAECDKLGRRRIHSENNGDCIEDADTNDELNLQVPLQMKKVNSQKVNPTNYAFGEKNTAKSSHDKDSRLEIQELINEAAKGEDEPSERHSIGDNKSNDKDQQKRSSELKPLAVEVNNVNITNESNSKESSAGAGGKLIKRTISNPEFNFNKEVYFCSNKKQVPSPVKTPAKKKEGTGVNDGYKKASKKKNMTNKRGGILFQKITIKKRSIQNYSFIIMNAFRNNC